MTQRRPARSTTLRSSGIAVAALLVVIVAIAAALGAGWPASSSSTAASPSELSRAGQRGASGAATSSAVWPAYGQAAFIRTGRSEIQVGPNQHAAPIASVAKVMTAYLVLRDHPLEVGQEGPEITLTTADAADTERRRRQGESIVPVE